MTGSESATCAWSAEGDCVGAARYEVRSRLRSYRVCSHHFENLCNGGGGGGPWLVSTDAPRRQATLGPVGPAFFRLYRLQPPAGYREGGYAGPREEPQLEGVVFSDGAVAVRWLTGYRSVSVWRDFATFEAVHGHPEYLSETRWQAIL